MNEVYSLFIIQVFIILSILIYIIMSNVIPEELYIPVGLYYILWDHISKKTFYLIVLIFKTLTTYVLQRPFVFTSISTIKQLTTVLVHTQLCTDTLAIGAQITYSEEIQDGSTVGSTSNIMRESLNVRSSDATKITGKKNELFSQRV